MTKLSWMCEHDDCQLPKEGKTPFCSGHNKALRDIARDLAKPVKPVKSLRRVPVQKISEKQVDIKMELNATYEFLDNMANNRHGMLVCEAYPEKNEHNTIIDHSHTVSQDRCKKLGHPEWIYAEWNIEHCSRVAHEEWDHYKPEFIKHTNFGRRMSFLKMHDMHDYERRMAIWAKHNPAKETV